MVRDGAQIMLASSPLLGQFISMPFPIGWCQQREKIDWQEAQKFDIGEWPENQILIPDWTHLYCPGATLLFKIRENSHMPGPEKYLFSWPIKRGLTVTLLLRYQQPWPWSYHGIIVC